MTNDKKFSIEKKTPNGNWYPIHNEIDRDTIAEIMADIAKKYDSENDTTIDEIVDMVNSQIEEREYAVLCVCDHDADGSDGDMIYYRAVAA